MGLLDEAIREHLELKRRRGADTTEITRQEQEAFGPARRGDIEVVNEAPEPALDAPAEFAAEEAVTTLHAVEDPPVESDPPRPHGDPADDLPHVEEPPEHEHHEVSDPPRPHGDPADNLPHVEEAPVQEHRVVEPPASTGQPTRAFDPDEVRAASGLEPDVEEDAPADEDADVLEETPEFLQETPEHDRLWFEQRPPRDFDF